MYRSPCGDSEAREVGEPRTQPALEHESGAARRVAQHGQPDRVRIADECLADDETATGSQDAANLAKCGQLIRNLTQDPDEKRGVEGAVRF